MPKLASSINWMVWEMTTGSLLYEFDSKGIKLIPSTIILLYLPPPFVSQLFVAYDIVLHGLSV